MLSTRMIILLVALFIGIALPAIVKGVLLYVIFPIRRIGERLAPARATATVVPLETLPAATRQIVEHCTARFALAGFSRGAIVRYEGIEGNAAEVIFENAAGDLASLIAIMNVQAQNHTLVVRSFLPDDEELTTAGWQAVSVFPRDPKAHSIRCSWVKDPAVLVELHRRRLAKLGKPSIGRPYPPGGLLPFLDEQFAKSSRRFGEVGYAKLDVSGEWYVHTVKGAFLAIWKLLPPWRGRRTAAIEREGRRVWRELDMDRYTPPVDPIATADVATVAPPGSLDYNVRLAAGAMTQEWRGPVLVIRMGNPTLSEVLKRQWLNLLSLAFFAVLLIANLTIWYQMPGGSGFRMSGMFYVVIAFLAWDAWLLVSALLKLRGTTVLTVGPAGIDFQNAPGRPRDGSVSREDLSGLFAHATGEQSFRRKSVGLTAVTHGDERRILLLTGPDADAIEQVRIAIRRAMQLDPATGSMSQN